MKRGKTVRVVFLGKFFNGRKFKIPQKMMTAAVIKFFGYLLSRRRCCHIIPKNKGGQRN